MSELKLRPPTLRLITGRWAELSLRPVEADSATTLFADNITDLPYQKRQKIRCWSEVQVEGQGTRTGLGR